MSKKHRNRRSTQQSGIIPLTPIVYDQPRIGRNDPCPCGCGNKFKNCMGKPEPSPAIAATNSYGDMRTLYSDNQKEQEKEFIRQWGFEPNPAQLLIFHDGDPEEMKHSVIESMKVVGKNNDKDYSQFEYVIDKCNRLLTPLNQDMWTDEEKKEWETACTEFSEENAESSS